MILFLTSSPGGSYKEDGRRLPSILDGSNGFVDNLKDIWHDSMRCLMIAAAPDDAPCNDSIANNFAAAFPMSGLPLSSIDICDNRRNDISVEELCSYDLIILSGGHVPTQNAYFQKISLAEKLEDYNGIIIGISAGTMNCATLVYAMPELAGESIDPNYQRFAIGLGISDFTIIPHYDFLKDEQLDGKRAIDGIACPDSEGKDFIALTDGSYILVKDGKSTLYGEAYRIQDGFVRPLCQNGQVLELI